MCVRSRLCTHILPGARRRHVLGPVIPGYRSMRITRQTNRPRATQPHGTAGPTDWGAWLHPIRIRGVIRRAENHDPQRAGIAMCPAQSCGHSRAFSSRHATQTCVVNASSGATAVLAGRSRQSCVPAKAHPGVRHPWTTVSGAVNDHWADCVICSAN